MAGKVGKRQRRNYQLVYERAKQFSASWKSARRVAAEFDAVRKAVHRVAMNGI